MIEVVQLIEGKRGRGGDGSVGEVEDARGLVGEDESDAGQAVQRPGSQSDDDKGKELCHACASLFEPVVVTGWQTPHGRRPSRSWATRVADQTVLPAASGQARRWNRVMLGPATSASGLPARPAAAPLAGTGGVRVVSSPASSSNSDRARAP